MLSKNDEAPRKIRLLDVGSCYNPIQYSPNAPAFDCTAIDLHPAHPSVKKVDFLRFTPSDESSRHDSEEIELDTNKWNPSTGSFDVVSMSLVLSYLPNVSQRRDMIRRATFARVSAGVQAWKWKAL